MHIQKIFIILVFNEALIDVVVTNLVKIPYVGTKLEAPFKELMIKQKARLHRKADTPEVSVSS